MNNFPDHPEIAYTLMTGYPHPEKPLPVCDRCGEPIYDDYVWDTPDGIICEDCLNALYRRDIENYMEE